MLILPEITLEAIESKSIVRGSGTPDSWFQGEYGLNPYQGCYHDCVYCDGKADFYRMQKPFGTVIKYKRNTITVLRRFFEKKGLISTKKPKLTKYIPIKSQKPVKFLLGIGGGVCDVYQPPEKKIGITRKILKHCLEYEVPIFILTKNSVLIQRDLDLLQQINDTSFCRVGFSVSLADPKLKVLVEPYSPSTESRFRMIKKLNNLGIESGGIFLPIIPLIGDTQENLEGIVKRAKEVNTKFLLHGGMSLKPGNKEDFFQFLSVYYPSLLPRYKEIYSHFFWPDPSLYKSPNLEVHQLCKEKNIQEWIPRYVPDGKIAENLLSAAHLWAIAMMYMWHGNSRKAKTFENAGYKINGLDCPWNCFKELPFPKTVLETLQEYKETETSTIFHSLY